jgi:hypothetical protein
VYTHFKETLAEIITAVNISKLNVYICKFVYNQTYLMWLSNGKLKYGPIRQVVAKYRFNQYEMHCELKLKLKVI